MGGRVEVRRSFAATAAAGMVLAAALAGCSGDGGGDGGGGGGDGGGMDPPVSFPIGEASGPAASATIGPEGGTLDSTDGVLRVTIDPGTLAEDTTIEIQPITNTAPGGMGKAYRLSPDGTTFASPVRLTFAMTAADLQGSVADALKIGYQDGDGMWWAARDVVHDAEAETISATTTHFSDWSRLSGLQLRPPEATVKQGETLGLTAVDCEPEQADDGQGGGEELFTLLARCSIDEELAPLPGFIQEWAVDGIPGGSDAAGTVVPGSRPDQALYTAPDFAVGIEHHTVSARIRRRNGQVTLLVANITVIGAFSFEVSGIYTDDQSYVPCNLVPSQIGDRIDAVLAPNDAGVYNLHEVTNHATTFALGPLPPGDPGSLRQDSPPEFLTVESASVVMVQGSAAFGVTLTGTTTSGGCTYIVDDQEIGLPAMTMPSGAGLTFAIGDLIDGSLVVVDEQWSWTITQIE